MAGPTNQLRLGFAVCAFLALGLQAVRSEDTEEHSACPAGTRLWDKKFDTCNWCVCTTFGWKCTRTICNALTNVPPACYGRQQWRDGCYTCTCHSAGQITCRADEDCVRGLRFTPIACNFSNLCLCGVDGVPVCAADFSKSSLLADFSDSWRQQSWARTRTLLLGRSCSVATRWYLGGRRCHCRREGGSHRRHCGQPASVAHNQDVFSVQHVLCERGMSWAEGTCRRCQCHVSGVVFCAPDPDCQQEESNDLVLTGGSRPRNDRCTRIGHMWAEGCQVCFCSSDSKRHCRPMEGCQQTTTTTTTTTTTEASNSIQSSGEPEEGDCDGRKDGEQFYIRCNLCLCRSGTVLCQQKACPFYND